MSLTPLTMTTVGVRDLRPCSSSVTISHLTLVNTVATTNPDIETIQNIDTYMHSPGSLQYPLVSLHPGAHTAET